jgi:hypothetical protein
MAPSESSRKVAPTTGSNSDHGSGSGTASEIRAGSPAEVILRRLSDRSVAFRSDDAVSSVKIIVRELEESREGRHEAEDTNTDNNKEITKENSANKVSKTVTTIVSGDEKNEKQSSTDEKVPDNSSTDDINPDDSISQTGKDENTIERVNPYQIYQNSIAKKLVAAQASAVGSMLSLILRNGFDY